MRLCLDGLRKIKLCILWLFSTYIPDEIYGTADPVLFVRVGGHNGWELVLDFSQRVLLSHRFLTSVLGLPSYIPDGFWFTTTVAFCFLIVGGFFNDKDRVGIHTLSMQDGYAGYSSYYIGVSLSYQMDCGLLIFKYIISWLEVLFTTD